MINEYESCHKVLDFVGVYSDSFYIQLELKEFSSFKDWMKKTFEKQNLEDIVNNGCIGGFNGLTYYYETMALYRQFRDEIWEILANDSKDFGYKNILEFVSTFDGASNVDGENTFENLIVWYVGERVAREILQEINDKDFE